MKEFLAHTANPKGDPHLLREHLSCVGKLAEKFIREANAELSEQARWAGFLHDLGKYRDEFQAYLIGDLTGSNETHHAVYGAALAFQKRWIPVAFAIAAHHAGLHNRHQLSELFQRYDAFNRLSEIVGKFEKELGKIPEKIKTPQFLSERLKLEMATRMIFSCLVDADFLDTEAHYRNGEERKIIDFDPPELLKKIIAARETKVENARADKADEKLIEIRNQIFDNCLQKAEESKGFFSLTVPTGGGKTLSAMAFALRHAETHRLKRVIVVIPYLSIIEQNSEEYRKIFDTDGTGLIVENHSAVKIEAENAEEKHSSETKERHPLVLAAENWDVPVIITTSVQFIESLFSNKTSRCRKLHNIANSVVIFDEVQTLPAHLLEPLFSVWRELRENYGVSFVFSTATQPAFRRQFNLKNGFTDGEMTEIIENPAEIFQSLQRVRYELPKQDETKTFDEIADEMLEEQQVMCVLNTRRQAFEIFSKLAENTNEGIFHLSSAMCAEHRLKVIEEIKTRLGHNKTCRVVSTQLVEAGVDLDFPVVYRALAPLDSIVQAAGRCNREGKLEFGEVKVFVPAEHRLPTGIYKTATQVTSSLVRGFSSDELARNPQIFADYFSQLFNLTQTGIEIESERNELNFREVAKAVKVIENVGFPVIVPFGGDYGKPMKIVREIRGKNRQTEKLWFGKDDLRRLQRFMVNLNPRDFEFLKNRGQLHPLVEDKNLDLWVLSIGSYNKDFGVLTDSFPTTDLLGGI